MKYRATFHKVWDSYKSGSAYFVTDVNSYVSENDCFAKVESGEMTVDEALRLLGDQYEVFEQATLPVLKTGLRFLVERPEMLDRGGEVGQWSCRLPVPRMCVELRHKLKDGTREAVWLFAAAIEGMNDTLREAMVSLGFQVPDSHIQITVATSWRHDVMLSPVAYVLCWVDGKPAIMLSRIDDTVPEGVAERFGTALAYHVETFIRFLNLINCRGVSYSPVAPQRKSTNPRPNKKQSGKRYTYHVVDALMKPVEAYGPGTGTRQRLHLRRGHIRTYHSGDAIWIDPYFAGDAELGVIVKDYTTNHLRRD